MYKYGENIKKYGDNMEIIWRKFCEYGDFGLSNFHQAYNMENWNL